MAALVEAEAPVARRIEAEPRERARDLADVGLHVVSLAEREQLEQLAREVLVRPSLHVAMGVEVAQQDRVGEAGLEQPREAAAGLGAEQRVLVPHAVDVLADALEGGDEVVVPEQRHALGERRRRRDHLRVPPRLELLQLRAPRLDEGVALALAHARMHVAVGWPGCVEEGGPRQDRRAPHARQEQVHRLLARERREFLDLRGRGAEARAREQVARLLRRQRAPLRRGEEGCEQGEQGDEDAHGSHGACAREGAAREGSRRRR
jgi:hypothetical protein